MRSASLLALALTLACKPDDGSGGDDTTAAATSALTETSPSDGSAATGPTETSPAGGTTGDDAKAALDAACAAYCAAYEMCPDTTPGECSICYGSIVARCVGEGVAYLGCLAEQTCEALMGGEDPCQELEDVLEAGECYRLCEGVTVEPGPTCVVEIQCSEEPLQRVECGQGGCVCIVEGVVVKECPDGFCDAEDQLPSQNSCEGV